MECELDQKIWGVVSSTQSHTDYAHTYASALWWREWFIRVWPELDATLFITTFAAAARFTQKEKAA